MFSNLVRSELRSKFWVSGGVQSLSWDRNDSSRDVGVATVDQSFLHISELKAKDVLDWLDVHSVCLVCWFVRLFGWNWPSLSSELVSKDLTNLNLWHASSPHGESVACSFRSLYGSDLSDSTVSNIHKSVASLGKLVFSSHQVVEDHLVSA